MENGFTYLGDGVYAAFDGYGVQIHVNNHEFPTDKVYLEPPVLQNLVKFYTNSVTPQKDEN